MNRLWANDGDALMVRRNDTYVLGDLSLGDLNNDHTHLRLKSIPCWWPELRQ